MLLLFAALLALLGLAVVGDVAFSNDDARGYSAFTVYLAAVVLLPILVAVRSQRRGHPIRRSLFRASVAVLVIQLPAAPVILTAMAM